jgi:2'-5' RNA ligase
LARDRESHPEAKPLRLFVAVDVPDDVKAGLATAIAPYSSLVPGARWTRRDGWHVTMKFIGSTWPRLLDGVRGAVATAATTGTAFETGLTEVGVFPSRRLTRVVWAGLSDPEGRFAALAGALDESLADMVEPEGRAFTPHLTLARLNPARDIGEFAPNLIGLPLASAPFPAGELVLYRSQLAPSGATYEALERFPLGAGR